jgi:hypothetical protein
VLGDGSAEMQLEAARRMMQGGGASMVYHFMGDEDIERIMRDPFVSVASDAGLIEFGRGVPHPRGYGNTVRVLGEYVRARGVLTLEDAVRRMTSLAARSRRPRRIRVGRQPSRAVRSGPRWRPRGRHATLSGRRGAGRRQWHARGEGCPSHRGPDGRRVEAGGCHGPALIACVDKYRFNE